jgi:CHAD domain-containing protein
MPTRKPVTTAKSARFLAKRECRAILRALVPGNGVHERIHAARKAIRRLRALLQLVENRVDGVAIADRILQRTGDSLSALRDAHVTIATASRLARRRHGGCWDPVVAHLVRRRDALLGEVLAQDPGFQRRRAWVERAARYLEAADWEDVGPRDLRRGLERGQRRVDKARRRAMREPGADNLHRWRRRVRKLRMQMQAVAKVAPELASAADTAHGKQVRALRGLSDRLGRLQDLEVLHALLREAADVPEREALLAELDRAEAKLAASLPA